MATPSKRTQQRPFLTGPLGGDGHSGRETAMASPCGSRSTGHHPWPHGMERGKEGEEKASEKSEMQDTCLVWTREVRVMDIVRGRRCQLLQGREQHVECSKGFVTR